MLQWVPCQQPVRSPGVAAGERARGNFGLNPGPVLRWCRSQIDRLPAGQCADLESITREKEVVILSL